MFGLNDNTTQSNDDPAMLDNVKQLASEPADNVVPQTPMQQQMASTTAADATASVSTTDDTTAATQPSTSPLQGFTMDAPTPAAASQPVDSPVMSATMPVADSASDTDAPAETESVETTPATPAEPVVTVTSAATDTPAPDPNHLAGLKQEALTHLEPLTEHLDGTPEEVFKTTMMMIQANDNHTLLEKALEAAKKIEDDKARAQAMLDIINEINYFAQTSQQD